MTASIANIVNVKEKPLQPLASFSISKVGLFTHETPLINMTDGYMEFIRYSEVQKYFDANSRTLRMAKNIFGANNTISDKTNYSLTIVPFNSTFTEAKRASITTAGLSSNLTNFQAESNASITIDSVELSGLNFTKATSINDIFETIERAVIKKKLNISLYFNSSTNAISFESKNAGVDSSISVAPGSTGTDLSGVNFFDISNVTTIAGADEIEGESFEDAIKRVYSVAEFTAFTTTLDLDIDYVLSVDQKIKDIAITTPAGNPSECFKVFIYNIPNETDSSAVYNFYTSDNTVQVKNTILFSGKFDKEEGFNFISQILSELSSISYKEDNYKTLSGKALLGLTIANGKHLVDDSSLQTLRDAGIHTYAYFSNGLGYKFLYSSVVNYAPEQIIFLAEFLQTLQVEIANVFATNTVTEDNKSIISDVVYREIMTAKNNLFLTSLQESASVDIFANNAFAKETLNDRGGYVELSNIANNNIVVKIGLSLSNAVYTVSLNYQVNK